MTERFSDQRFSTKGGGVVAAVIACVIVVLWWTVGDASRAESRRRYQAALMPDVIPSSKLELRGNIRLVDLESDTECADAEPIFGHCREGRIVCSAICAALLALPGVESVTLVNKKYRHAVWRYRLVPKGMCNRPSVIPRQPDLLRPQRERWEEASGLAPEERSKARMLAARALETSWRIRLSVSDCIIADQVGTVSTFTIRDETHIAFGDANWRSKHDDWAWTFDALPVSTRRLEVRDSEGEVRIRRSFTSTSVLSKPLLPGAVGRTGNMGFPVYGWSRDQLQNFRPKEEYNAQTLLIEHTNIAGGLKIVHATTAIATELRRVLDDPRVPASDPAFPLAETWMRSLTAEGVTEADKALLIDLIKDRRVTEFQGVWDAVRALGHDAHILAEPIRWRIEVDLDKRGIVGPLSAQLSKISEDAYGSSNVEPPTLNMPDIRVTGSR